MKTNLVTSAKWWVRLWDDLTARRAMRELRARYVASLVIGVDMRGKIREESRRRERLEREMRRWLHEQIARCEVAIKSMGFYGEWGLDEAENRRAALMEARAAFEAFTTEAQRPQRNTATAAADAATPSNGGR